MSSAVYINYSDVINEQKAKAFMEACVNVIEHHKPAQLYFLFSSTGGSVDAGIVIYNFLRALPIPIVMHNIGNIDSIANVIFLAADKRLATANSSFLFHGIQWGFPQGANLSWTQLQEIVSRFQASETRMSNIILERTSITKDELNDLFHQGETKNLEFAKEKGVIHQICEAEIIPGSPFLSLNFP